MALGMRERLEVLYLVEFIVDILREKSLGFYVDEVKKVSMEVVSQNFGSLGVFF